MITFTEHNEVIMSISEMRDIIREAARQGARQAEQNMTVNIDIPQLTKPVTFIVEDIRDILEKRIRATGSPQFTGE